MHALQEPVNGLSLLVDPLRFDNVLDLMHPLQVASNLAHKLSHRLFMTHLLRLIRPLLYL